MQLTRSGIRPAGARGVQQRAAFGALRRCCAASARGRPTARAVPPEQQPDATPSPLDAASGSSSSAGLGASTGAGEAAAPPPRLPTFDDGISWYCYTALTLLFLVDFTPLGAFLAAGPDAPLKLAAFQGAAFFAPSLAHAVKQRWDLGRTFNVGAPSAKWLAAGLAAGPLVWLVTTVAISLKTGVPLRDALSPDAAAAAAAAAAGGGGGAASGSGAGGGSLVSDLVAAAAASSSPQQVAALFASAAAAPAVMEELLFRGLLLTALRTRLGSVDAAALSAALFAAIHLSVEQFFPFCILGFATGAAAVGSGSVWPAVALHLSYNATALALGLALHR